MIKRSLFVLLAVLAIGVSAEEIYLSRTQEPTGITVLSEDFSDAENASIRLKYHLQMVESEEISTEKGTFTRLTVPGFFYTLRTGEPQLPVINRLIEVPLGAEVSAEVLSQTEQEYTLEELGIRSSIYPAQPSVQRKQKTVEFHYNPAAYNKKYAKDGEQLKMKDLGVVRNYRLYLMQAVVANYNPLEKKIKFYNDVQIKVNLTRSDMEKTMAFKQQYASEAFDAVIRPSVITSPTLASFARKKTVNEGYLIIADGMFRNALQPFVAMKSQKGHTVEVAYTDQIGTTKEQIKQFLKTKYQAVDGVPTFVLFVGDTQQIPVYTATQGQFVTDLYHVTMTDGDYLPDYLYGRFSAQTVAQLTPQLDKTISYQNGSLPDYGFLKKLALVAGWDSYWTVKRGYPQIRYGTKYHFTSANGFLDIAAGTFLSSASQQNVSPIFNTVNKGVGLYNYTAHGEEFSFHDPSFKMSDIDKLTNNGKYPLVIGNCCLTNSFNESECFGEKWMRVANKGAIGFIGGSSYTYWDEDLWWGTGACAITSGIDAGNAPDKAATGIGAYDAAFEKHSKFHFSNGGAVLAGNLAVQQANSHLTQYYFEVYHLLGDPGMPAYWATPDHSPAVTE